MFTLLCNLRHWLKESQEKEAAFAVLGLDNAGKTTVTKALQGKVFREARPTVGFQRGNETKSGGYTLKFHDMGGGVKIRKIWESYYADSHGVIYVVDASDEERLAESKQCLAEVREHAQLAGKPILIFANKQDLPGALSAPELSQRMGLGDDIAMRGDSHRIQACQALMSEGEGIDPRISGGLEWLRSAAAKRWKELEARVREDCAERDEAQRIKNEERKARVAKMKAERKAKQEAEAAAEAAKVAAEAATAEATGAAAASRDEQPPPRGGEQPGVGPSSSSQPAAAMPPGMVAPSSPVNSPPPGGQLPPLRAAPPFADKPPATPEGVQP
jgi:ADP-ribosylation factor-like protein 13B